MLNAWAANICMLLCMLPSWCLLGRYLIAIAARHRRIFIIMPCQALATTVRRIDAIIINHSARCICSAGCTVQGPVVSQLEPGRGFCHADPLNLLHTSCCAVLCRGLWFPKQKLDEVPAMSPAVLLSSSFAQEQYITLPAAQLASMPGTYMLQVSVLTDQTAPCCGGGEGGLVGDVR